MFATCNHHSLRCRGDDDWRCRIYCRSTRAGRHRLSRPSRRIQQNNQLLLGKLGQSTVLFSVHFAMFWRCMTIRFNLWEFHAIKRDCEDNSVHHVDLMSPVGILLNTSGLFSEHTIENLCVQTTPILCERTAQQPNCRSLTSLGGQPLSLLAETMNAVVFYKF